jgi:hypothetical protein
VNVIEINAEIGPVVFPNAVVKISFIEEFITIDRVKVIDGIEEKGSREKSKEDSIFGE